MTHEAPDQTESHPDPAQARPARRKFLATGAAVVPAILTLHATPAWATTDYTLTAYRYGAHAGLCRNARFNPNADPSSAVGQEFIECRQRPRHWEESETPSRPATEDAGPSVIRIK